MIIIIVMYNKPFKVYDNHYVIITPFSLTSFIVFTDFNIIICAVGGGFQSKNVEGKGQIVTRGATDEPTAVTVGIVVGGIVGGDNCSVLARKPPSTRGWRHSDSLSYDIISQLKSIILATMMNILSLLNNITARKINQETCIIKEPYLFDKYQRHLTGWADRQACTMYILSL